MQTTLFVHPGYLRRQDMDQTFLRQCRENPEYGSYEEYFANLNSLYQKTDQAVLIVETQQGQLHPYASAFTPRENALVLEWKAPALIEGGPCFAVLKYTKKQWIWDILLTESEFSNFLTRRGIDEVLLAGELGPYERSAEGCVGAMWSYLDRDMGVKGIQGYVFPLIPYK